MGLLHRLVRLFLRRDEPSPRRRVVRRGDPQGNVWLYAADETSPGRWAPSPAWDGVPMPAVEHYTATGRRRVGLLVSPKALTRSPD